MLESELFQLLEGTTDAGFVVTEQGEICSWNRAAEKLFGYAASEVLHKTCHEVLEGRGALGTPVCHENCSVLECVGKKEEVPNFDLKLAWGEVEAYMPGERQDGKARIRFVFLQSGPGFHRDEDNAQIGIFHVDSSKWKSSTSPAALPGSARTLPRPSRALAPGA